MTTKPIVLFLCTGNSARSQMAEALLRSKAPDRFDARSAGTDPAPAVHPLAIEAMQDIGIDISNQKPKGVSEYLGHIAARHLIIVCDGANQKCPSVYPGVVTRDFWPIDDPASSEPTLGRFREARDEISARLDDWLSHH